MQMATLRSVGGSVMMAIPKAMLEGLGLSANSKVALTISDGRLLVEAHPKAKYVLSDLMAQCDLTAPQDRELESWDIAEPVGREIL